MDTQYKKWSLVNIFLKLKSKQQNLSDGMKHFVKFG